MRLKSRMKNNGKGGSISISGAEQGTKDRWGDKVPEERRNWCQAKDLRG